MNEEELILSFQKKIGYNFNDKKFILVDHNSANGTFVNQKKICKDKIILTNNDTIRFGNDKNIYIRQ